MFKNINYSEDIISILNNTFNENNMHKNVSLLLKKLYNVLDLNFNEIAPAKSINLNKFHNYVINDDFITLENGLTILNKNASVIDDSVQNLNKLNFNFTNLKLNYVQNIEYYK